MRKEYPTPVSVPGGTSLEQFVMPAPVYEHGKEFTGKYWAGIFANRHQNRDFFFLAAIDRTVDPFPIEKWGKF